VLFDSLQLSCRSRRRLVECLTATCHADQGMFGPLIAHQDAGKLQLSSGFLSALEPLPEAVGLGAG